MRNVILRIVLLNVSLKSIPGICEKPRATRRALKRIIFPIASVFFRRTHLQLTLYRSGGGSKRLQVLFFNKTVISSTMTALYLGSSVPDNPSRTVRINSFAVSGSSSTMRASISRSTKCASNWWSSL